MKYKFIDEITSDVIFEAYGKDKKELFENSAEALFSVICKIKEVKPKIKKTINIKGKDLKDLLFNWLQELIGLVDTEEMFFSRFDVKEISNNDLTADIYGEPISAEKGETVVKAVTYYKFDIKKEDNIYIATVSLDI